MVTTSRDVACNVWNNSWESPNRCVSQEKIDECVELLKAGSFAIWVGFGSRGAATEIRQLAERTGAAVICSPRQSKRFILNSRLTLEEIMELFESIIKFLILISVGTSALTIYLGINKMWTRKHDPIVAASLSPIAMGVLISTSLPFFLNYTLQNNWSVALTYLFRLTQFTIFFLVAIGFWVKDPQHNGIWQKFIKALKQEANESTNLIKALNQPSGKKQLLNILYRIAWLDDKLDEKERQYIQMFADTWEIDPSHLFAEPPPENGIEKLNKVREEVIAYLAIKPSKEQALSLSDVIQVLIKIDEEITKEEELIGAEISGILRNYGSKENTMLYGVIIHPTNQKEQENVLALVPEVKEEYILGDQAFIVATFQTYPYAEAFSAYYREQGLFTTVHTYNAC